jgi:imidazolonepropionase-like amidohydrolase
MSRFRSLMKYGLVAGMLATSLQAQSSFIIRDVRVFDGTQVLEHRSVRVDSGRITAVDGPTLRATGATIIDGRGKTLIPGLIDSHVHVADDATSALRQSLVLGVTTVIDMFSSGDRFEKMNQLRKDDAPDLADLRSAGVGATVPGGHPTQMGGPPFPTVSGPADADAFVRDRVAAGSDFLKIIRDALREWSPQHPAPTLDSLTVAALVSAAHRNGLLAVAHITREDDARIVLGSGVDGLAHLFPAQTVSADFGAFVAAHGAFVIPTLVTFGYVCGRPDARELLCDSNITRYLAPAWRTPLTVALGWPSRPAACAGTDSALKQLMRARVPILAGTDAPIPGATYGASLHGELAMLVHVGMSPLEALRAATSSSASAFHLDDRGTIHAGKRADLVLVDGDPTRDILATRRIVEIWKRGVPVVRTPLADSGQLHWRTAMHRSD